MLSYLSGILSSVLRVLLHCGVGKPQSLDPSGSLISHGPDISCEKYSLDKVSHLLHTTNCSARVKHIWFWRQLSWQQLRPSLAMAIPSRIHSCHHRSTKWLKPEVLWSSCVCNDLYDLVVLLLSSLCKEWLCHRKMLFLFAFRTAITDTSSSSSTYISCALQGAKTNQVWEAEATSSP